MGTLNDLFGSWDNVKDEDLNNFGEGIPDGDYLAKVQSVDIEDAKSGNGKVIVTKLHFIGPNKTETDWFYPDGNDMKAKIMKGRLKALGLTASSPSQLMAALRGTAGWTLKINKKTNTKDGKTYKNYNYRGVVEKPESDPNVIPF